MYDFDIRPLLGCALVVGVAVGAALVLLVSWLVRHLDVSVIWQ